MGRDVSASLMATLLVNASRGVRRAGEDLTEQSREQVSDNVPCGDDIEEHVTAVRAYLDAGFDEVYIGQVGPGQGNFFTAFRDKLLPALSG